MVSNNIKFLRKREHLTQEQLAHKIGIKRSLIGAYEEGRADPRLNNLLKMSELFRVSVDAMISRDLPNQPESKWENEVKTRILTLTVDREGAENIELIPQKASAGYLNGYADPEFLEDLPKFRLPFLPGNNTHRAFEIIGDSMLPLLPGTIVIGKYLESVDEIKDNKTYVLLTISEGIVYKRIQTSKINDGSIVLVSDNKNYEPYPVSVSDILEIWEAVMYISNHFPEVNPSDRSDIEELKNMVLGLQQEVIKLKQN
jgi:transcriptional regulator with XRE-family HTH domain